MPWLSVADNVAFGLRHLGKAEKEARVEETLARALTARPKVLLLDEPFSALDAFTRLALQEHLLELWSYDKPTFVLVTHDIDEALSLADRIVLMRGHPGRVHRDFTVDLPRPRSRSGARFLSWKEEVMRELHITVSTGRSAIVPSARRAAVV